MMKATAIVLSTLFLVSVAWADSEPARPSRSLQARYQFPVTAIEEDSLTHYFEWLEATTPKEYRRVEGTLYSCNPRGNRMFRVAPGVFFARPPQGVTIYSVMEQLKQSDVPRASEFRYRDYAKRDSLIWYPVSYPEELDPLNVLEEVERTGLFRYTYLDTEVRGAEATDAMADTTGEAYAARSTRTATLTPNDMYYSDQGYLSVIGVDEAWDWQTGNGATIGVCEPKGLDMIHAVSGDFSVAFKQNRSFSRDPYSIWDVSGDKGGHATWMFGIMAATTNNGTGVAGVAGGYSGSNASEVGVYVQWRSLSQLLEIFNSSTDFHNQFILTMAFSLFEDFNFNNWLDNNVGDHVYVCAAGNDNYMAVDYPSSHRSTISVGALESHNGNWDRSWSSSNYGNGLDITAPGENIRTTDLNGGYTSKSGTSMSTALVTGIAALLKSQCPDATPFHIKRALFSTADRIGEYPYKEFRDRNGNFVEDPEEVQEAEWYGPWNAKYGYGRVNALAAIQRFDTIVGIGTPPPPGVTTTTLGSGQQYLTSPYVVAEDNHLVISDGAIVAGSGGSLEIRVQRGAYLTIKSGSSGVTIDGSIVTAFESLLNIEDDATVRFTEGEGIVLRGALEVDGVTFERSGATGYWDGIKVENNGSLAAFRCDISEAVRGVYAVDDGSGNALPSVLLRDNEIYGSQYQGVYLNNVYQGSYVSRCTVRNNGTGGIYASSCERIFLNDNEVHDNDSSGEGIQLSNCTYVGMNRLNIYSNTVWIGNSRVGVSDSLIFGSNSSVTLSGSNGASVVCVGDALWKGQNLTVGSSQAFEIKEWGTFRIEDATLTLQTGATTSNWDGDFYAQSGGTLSLGSNVTLSLNLESNYKKIYVKPGGTVQGTGHTSVIAGPVKIEGHSWTLNSLVKDVMIRDFDPYGYGNGGIEVNNTSPHAKVEGCLIDGMVNTTIKPDYGIHCVAASPWIVDCVFRDLTEGVYAYNGSDPRMQTDGVESCSECPGPNNVFESTCTLGIHAYLGSEFDAGYRWDSYGGCNNFLQTSGYHARFVETGTQDLDINHWNGGKNIYTSNASYNIESGGECGSAFSRPAHNQSVEERIVHGRIREAIAPLSARDTVQAVGNLMALAREQADAVDAFFAVDRLAELMTRDELLRTMDVLRADGSGAGIHQAVAFIKARVAIQNRSASETADLYAEVREVSGDSLLIVESKFMQAELLLGVEGRRDEAQALYQQFLQEASSGNPNRKIAAKRLLHVFEVDVDEDIDDALNSQNTGILAAQPNPFNPSTTLRFNLSENGLVRISVYNVIGQRVRILMNTEVPTGRHTVSWHGLDDNGRDVSSGVYIIVMSTPTETAVTRVTLIR